MALVEIFKHKNKIAKYSRLSDDDLARLYHILLRRITLFKEDLISLDAFLWTGDKKLKVGLQAKGFKKLFEQAK